METRHVKPTGHGMYKRFGLMLVLSFAAMYVLMYAMVDTFSNVIHNINQVYMAGLMTAAMMVLEIIVMWSMYPKRNTNVLLLLLGIAALAVFFLGIRQQVAVRDEQFLKSMIPHHAAAILMVEKASVTDPEIKELAERIITAQQAEIDWMKAKLGEMENR